MRRTLQQLPFPCYIIWVIIGCATVTHSTKTIDHWEDQYEDCPAWADAFQCEKNPKFMLRKCIESCYLHDTVHQAVLSGSPSKVICETTLAPVVLELHPSWAPWGVNRFLKLVNDGYFNNSPLNRTQHSLLYLGSTSDHVLALKWETIPPIPDDDLKSKPMDTGFKRGMISFTKAPQEEGRSTHVFLTLVDDESLGHQPWETPIGVVVEGLQILKTISSNNSLRPAQNSQPLITKCFAELPIERDGEAEADLAVAASPGDEDVVKLAAIARTERRKRIRRETRIKLRTEEHARLKRREGDGDDVLIH